MSSIKYAVILLEEYCDTKKNIMQLINKVSKLLRYLSIYIIESNAIKIHLHNRSFEI